MDESESVPILPLQLEGHERVRADIQETDTLVKSSVHDPGVPRMLRRFVVS